MRERWGGAAALLGSTARKISHSVNTQRDFPGMGKNGFWLENSKAGSDFESWLNVPSNILLSFLFFFMCTKSDSLLVSIKYLEDGKHKKK